MLTSERQDPRSALAVYLRNHEAAARAGLDLFRRAARQQRAKPYAAELAGLAEEVAADLDSLHRLMRLADVHPDLLAGAAMRLGERLGRLKPNGGLLSRVPLSDLIEIEGCLDAVRAKSAGWRALLTVDSPPWAGHVDVETLLRLADDQAERLIALHRTAAAILTPAA